MCLESHQSLHLIVRFFFAIILLVSLLASEATSAQQVFYINFIEKSCNTYNNPSCFPEVTDAQVLVEGPWESGVGRYIRVCNLTYQAIPYIGYTGSRCAYSSACPAGQSWQLDGANFSCVDDECPFGDCESSSSSSSSTPICVPPYYYDPIVDDCVLDDSSSSASSGSASSTGDSGSSASSAGSSSSDGGSGSSSPGNPVPADSTCPNKFQIGDQWYCQSNPMPSSEGQASSDGAGAAAAGTCGAAPVCDGDPVGCAILLNAHYHRCNTDKTAEGGGDCSAEPACSGDPVGCSIALQNWKLRCDQHGDPLDGDADVAEYDNNFESEFGESNQASVDGEGALTHLAEVSDVVDFTSVDMSGLNISSTGRSSQCPQPRPISLSVGNFEVSYQPLCDLAEGLSTLVVLIFSYISVMLVWRSTQQG